MDRSRASGHAVLLVSSAAVSSSLWQTVQHACPGATLFCLWSGDPHLAQYSGRPFIPTPSAIRDIPLALVVIALDVVERDWAIAAAASAGLLERFDTVTVLRSGSVMIAGSLEALTSAERPGVRLIARSNETVRFDGRRPDPHDESAAGPYSSVAMSADANARTAMCWMAEALVIDPRRTLGSALTELQRHVAIHEIVADEIGAGAWRWPVGTRPLLVDISEPSLDGEQRVSAIERVDVREVLDELRDQLGGPAQPLTLPGGIRVDRIMRHLVGDAIVAHLRYRTPLPPDPFPATGDFLRWLDSPSAGWSPHVGRYWRSLWVERHDLIRAMPDPDGHDLAALQTWARTAWCHERRSPLVNSIKHVAFVKRASAHRNDGVNLVGYFSKDSSLGHVARVLRDQLTAAGVGTACIDVPYSPSPNVDDPPPTVHEASFERTLVVGSADSYGMIRSVLGTDLLDPATTDVYWFWELGRAPERHRRSAGLVRSLVAPSQFVANAYETAFGMAVQHVPFVVPRPAVGALPPRWADLPDSTVRFIVSFDYHSVSARKNPGDAVEAFCRAFRPDEGPLLIVKSTNAMEHPRDRDALVAQANGRSDIVFWDEVLRHDQQMAVVSAVDCVVSLHRSEGFGLHLAEAMWLGTPTIATRWSGNLDFQSDANAFLIDAIQVPVVDDLGVYEAGQTWAQPELGQAVAAMRVVAVGDDALGRLAAAGRDRMRLQPSDSVAGTLLWNSVNRSLRSIR